MNPADWIELPGVCINVSRKHKFLRRNVPQYPDSIGFLRWGHSGRHYSQYYAFFSVYTRLGRDIYWLNGRMDNIGQVAYGLYRDRRNPIHWPLLFGMAREGHAYIQDWHQIEGWDLVRSERPSSRRQFVLPVEQWMQNLRGLVLAQKLDDRP